MSLDVLKKNMRYMAALALIAGAAGAYALTLSPPSDFPSGSIVVVPRGATLAETADELSAARIIRHPDVLRAVLTIAGAGERVQAGPYLFESPENLLVVAYRLATGAYGIPPVKVTFPEGFTVREMGEKVHEAFPDISATAFFSAGKGEEGYLFPDTYHFPPDATVASMVRTMRDNFDAKLAPLVADVRASGRRLSDTVILASLVEKEARTSVNRRIVAGILLNRLRLGMPLQVDAVFGYIYGRDTYSPSFADLKVDSPYNTYMHPGLPPGPINNPGLDALLAVLHPTETAYLYYLTDRDGVMHYAKTYATHQANQAKYLR